MIAGDHPIGDAMAAYVAGAGNRTYDPAVVDMAKRCLVDWMGVAIGARHEPVSEIVAEDVMQGGAPGRSQILLGGATSPAQAAFANATMGHALDFDDTRGNAPSHLSSPTWAAVLAISDDLASPGDAALSAFITGYEVAAVLGDRGFGTEMQRVGFHPTAVFGRIAAAAATAALLDMNEEQAGHALGLAATSGGGLTGSFGTMAKPYHSGKAAMDGVQAAQLAARGFIAARGLFDGENGFADSFVQQGAAGFSGVKFSAGESLFVNSFKPYACGKLIHGHIDAARQLRDKVAGREIAVIRCAVTPHVTHLVGRPLPETPLEGKFSIAFCVALALNSYSVLPGDFSTDRLRDPAIRAIMDKVNLRVDEGIGRYGARMEIRLTDGETLKASVTRSRGNPENPLSWDDLKEKFDGLTAPVLGARHTSLYRALRQIDQPDGPERVRNQIQPD